MIYLVLLLVCIAIFAAGLVPNTHYVSPHDAFVYPEGPDLVLVLDTGSYIIQGSSQQAGGCYALTPPEPGNVHGLARWVWWIC